MTDVFAPPATPPDHFRDALATALDPAYALGLELGGGGMSRVFLAEERSLGRTVVVKVLPPDLAAGINRDRFRREIQLAARLQHPHIVPLLAAGEANGSLYYTMPYIEGESVRGALARGRRFSIREIVRLLHDVVDALAHAHARGIVHRDVKPGNVLLQGAHALVTDFGVAKALSAARGGTRGTHGTHGDGGDAFLTVGGATSTGLAIGTPAYMAPEQLAADPSADHRVDLYAAGLLAYELCTGASPFVADSPRATLAAQLTRMPEPLDRVRPDVPTALSDVVMHCLAKEPEDRPPTAEALLAALEAATQGVDLSGGERTTLAGADDPPDAHTAPVDPPVLAGPAATVAMPAAGGVRGGERRHAGLVAGLVAGAGLALLAGAAMSRARQPVAVPLPPAPPPAAVAPVMPPPVAPTVAAAPTVVPPSRPQLTREDSLAITAAVERRLAAEATERRQTEDRPMAPAEVEVLRADAWRHSADSITAVVRQRFGREMAQAFGQGMGTPGDPSMPTPPGRGPRVLVTGPIGAAAAGAAAAALALDPTVRRFAARAAPPPAGVHRVAVLDLTDGMPRPEFRPIAAATTEGLRRAVAAMPGYEGVDAALLRDLSRSGLPIPAAGVATHAGAVLSGTVTLRGDSLVMLVLVLHDLGRGHPRSVRAAVPLTPGATPESIAASLTTAVQESLTAALARVRWEF